VTNTNTSLCTVTRYFIVRAYRGELNGIRSDRVKLQEDLIIECVLPLPHTNDLLLTCPDSPLDYARQILKVNRDSGSVTVFAGSGATGNEDGAALSATFSSPHSLALGADGSVFVSDRTNNSIRMITPCGKFVTTVAGMPAMASGCTDGPALESLLTNPCRIASDSYGGLIFIDGQLNRKNIRRLHFTTEGDPFSGVITTLTPYRLDISVNTIIPVRDGRVGFQHIYLLTNSCIKLFDCSDKSLRTVVGHASERAYKEGGGVEAMFRCPSSMMCDGNGNFFIVDFNVPEKINCIRKVSQLDDWSTETVIRQSTEKMGLAKAVITLDYKGDIVCTDKVGRETFLITYKYGLTIPSTMKRSLLTIAPLSVDEMMQLSERDSDVVHFEVNNCTIPAHRQVSFSYHLRFRPSPTFPCTTFHPSALWTILT
jgi:hypothetical protein